MGTHKEHKHGMDGMISEDHSATANLPQHVIDKTYPRTNMEHGYYLDDTIRGVDENIDNTERKLRDHQSDSMY